MTAIITGYGGPAVRADTLKVLGSGFGRVSSAALINGEGESWEVDHIVDHGGSVTITIPQLLPDGSYVVVLGTLDNVDSQNLAGSFAVNGLPVAPPPRPAPPNPVPDPSSPAMLAIRKRLRMELGDFETPFQASVQGDGFTRRFDLPVEVVDPLTVSVMVVHEGEEHSYTTPQPVEGYTLDARNGVLTVAEPLEDDSILTMTGANHQFFTNDELDMFVQSAALKHSHNAEDLQVYRDARGFKRFAYGQETVDSISPVEHHAVALLAATEALEVIRTDAAYDIDVTTADGTSLPRSERFRNIGELIAEKRMTYDDLCRQLGVGLAKIEVFTMRRVSRTTNRLVPVYVSREYDDRRPVAPLRVFAPRNLGVTGSGFVQRDGYRNHVIDGDIVDPVPPTPIDPTPPVTPPTPPPVTPPAPLPQGAQPMDWTCRAGTTWRETITWAQQLPTGEMVPRDLTGAVGILQVRSAPDSPVLVTLRENAGLTFGGEDGTIEMHMTPLQTEALDGLTKRPYYDLLIRLADGDTYPVIDGRFTVEPNISVLP